MHSPKEIAQALGGEVSGGHIMCPGPGHSRIDRSLRVYIDWQSPDEFRVYSHANDPFDLCRDFVRARLGLKSFGADCTAKRKRLYEALHPETMAHVAGAHGSNKVQGNASANLAPAFTTDTARATLARVPASIPSNNNRKIALGVAKASKPISDTLAERYLITRLGQSMDWPACLRFHASCFRGTEQHPALIAVMRDAASNEFRAVQRVFLRPDGTDRLRDGRGKMTLGPAAGAVCKISPDDCVTNGLAIAEGVEKALAILAAGWGPIWSTQGAGTMAAFPVLPGIETLTIFADNGKAGQCAAQACADRWTAAEREVVIRTPRNDADWDECLRVAA